MTPNKTPLSPNRHEFQQRCIEMQTAFGLAVRQVLWVHKRLGIPVSAWIDGKLVITPPEEIDVHVAPYPPVDLTQPATPIFQVALPFTQNL